MWKYSTKKFFLYANEQKKSQRHFAIKIKKKYKNYDIRQTAKNSTVTFAYGFASNTNKTHKKNQIDKFASNALSLELNVQFILVVIIFIVYISY